MRPKKVQDNSFTQREIAEAANNLVVKTLSPKALTITPGRRRQLREYCRALVETCFEHVEEVDESGLRVLAPEELVMILACSTLYAHMRFVMKNGKLPAGEIAEDLLGD